MLTRTRRMAKKKLFFIFTLLTIAFIYKTSYETTISNNKNEKQTEVIEKIHQNELTPRTFKQAPINSDHHPKITIAGKNPENDIIYSIFNKYNLKSMIHISCGVLAQKHHILFNLTEQIKNFKYYGCDLDEHLIEIVKAQFKHMSLKWKFEKLNYYEQNLPEDYDIIFVKDALMYLSFEKILNTLQIIANTKGAKYLLTTSYSGVKRNRFSDLEKYHPINFLITPFNLSDYVYISPGTGNGNKMLVLYDIPNYLSKINFKSIKQTLN